MMTTNKGEERPVIVIGAAAAAAVFFVLAVSTFGTINDMEAQAQEEGGSNIITITGTTSGEKVWIREYLHQSEICTNAGTVVRGTGLTSLGEEASCPSNAEYRWDISPDPDGVNTRYRVDGNGVLGGGSNLDGVEVDDERESDNDVYILDADQFFMFDGPRNDRYDLTGDSALGTESVI